MQCCTNLQLQMLLLHASGYTKYFLTFLRTVQSVIQLPAHSFTIITDILFNVFIIEIVWNSQNTYSYFLRDILYKSRQRDGYPQAFVESVWPAGKFFNSGPSLTQATGMFRPPLTIILLHYSPRAI